MSLVTDLEGNTAAIFVGEPTGARPNAYGDSRKTLLPNTGLTIRASSLFWQSSDPRDDRPFTEPHLAAALASRDAAANRDPVLDLLASVWSRPTDPVGVWRGVATYRFHRFPITLEFAKGASEGWFTAPALELDRVAVGGIQLEDGVLSFDLPSPVGVIPARAWLGGERMVGSGERGGRRIVFALERGR
jgi:hypothetical protein